MGAVELRLLGPVAVWVDGEEVAAGPPRQRCVLAVLVMGHGRPVPVDTLVDRVWGDEPPAKARDVLYSYIARLRTALPSDRVRLTRTAAGYVCEVDDDDVDVHRFTRLIGEADRADDPEDAVELLSLGLHLWQGEPLGGLSGTWAADTRQRLYRQRLAARTNRNDRELRLDRHAALVVRLTEEVDEDPTAEPLVGQLMTALHRSGRSAEALALFRRTRLLLIEAQGMEPGSALRRIEHDILASPPLEAPRSTLPVDIRGFVGREDELSQLDKLADDANNERCAVTVAVLSGVAGGGKTSLAVHWAHRAADRFPDGRFYVNLLGFTVAAAADLDVLAMVLSALGAAHDQIPTTSQARADMLRRMTADRRSLLVLDNASTVADVLPVVRAAAGCFVIVTSRRRFPELVVTHSAYPMHVDLMTQREARRLLMHRLGRRPAEAATLDQIAAACGRLPLALALVAGHAASRPTLPLAELAQELADPRHRLDLLDTSGTSGIRAAFELSYLALSPAAARGFRLLALAPGAELSLVAAAAVTGLTLARAAALTNELSRVNLLVEQRRDRFAFHDLIRLYAMELSRTADSVEDRSAAVRRVLDHYATAAATAAALFDPYLSALDPLGPRAAPDHERFDDAASAVAWLTTERHQLLAAVLLAQSAGLHRHTVSLAWNLHPFLERQRHWQDDLLVQTAAIQASENLDDGQRAYAYRAMASALARLGDHDTALIHHQTSLSLAQRTGDRMAIARALDHLAVAYWHLCHVRHALRYANRAIRMFEAIGERRAYALSLNVFGWCLTSLTGHHRTAAILSRQAALILDELGHQRGAADAWHSAGYAHHQLGEHEAAVENYQRSLSAYRSLGGINDLVTSLRDLAAAYEALGRTAEAEAARADATRIDRPSDMF